MAAVALANGINANLLRRWVIDQPSHVSGTASAAPRKGFVALSLPAPSPSVSAASDIRVEVRRGSMTTTRSILKTTVSRNLCANAIDYGNHMSVALHSVWYLRGYWRE
jgi:transposase